MIFSRFLEKFLLNFVKFEFVSGGVKLPEEDTYPIQYPIPFPCDI